MSIGSRLRASRARVRAACCVFLALLALDGARAGEGGRSEPFAASASVPTTAASAPAPVSAVVPSLGWLPELAGRCWRQAELDVDACYWQITPERVHFLSRNGRGLLGCGALERDAGNGGLLRVRTWDEERRGPDEFWAFGDGAIIHTEAQRSYPEAVGRRTLMTRPTQGQYEVIRRGVYGADGPRPGQERVMPSSVTFVDSGRLEAADAHAQQCVALDAKLPPYVPQ